MKNNLIQEETNRAKLLWGYDTKLTLNEQATGGTTDPYYCVGGVAGMSCVQSSGAPGGTTTGGPFNTLADCQTSGCGGSTTTTCNKTCQQLVPGFKKKVGNKPCNWLNNRLNAFTRKLSTKTPGSCGAKRITCKIGVVKELLQNLGC
jgi:hypothetical protein